jgi:AcrR family transcriptional regulator
MPTINRRPEKRRGRPPSPEQTQKTESAILGAAVDLFLERGFAETRMEEIAQRAEVAKGTLYLYFPTKSAMLEAVLKKVVAEPLLGISAVPLRNGESVQAFLRRTLLPLLRAGKSPQLEGMLRLIMTEATRFPEFAAIYRRVALDPMTSFLKKLAERARAGGELRSGSDALERFPLLFMTPALMASVWNGLHEPEQQISAAAAFEALLDLIFVEERRA